MNNTIPVNPLLDGLHESDTLAINERSKALMAGGKHIYRFGLGQSPFPVPESIVRSLRLHAPHKDYLPVKGLATLREAVADFHRRKDGLDALPDQVIIGPGSKELVFLLQLVFDGEIIIVSPCWVSYIPQARILGKEISIIYSNYENKWQLTPALFEQFLLARKNKSRPSLLILNYPGNPDGVTFNADELEQIARLARQHGVYILSDEIYGQLNHQGRHVSISRYYPEGTIVSSGLSKWCGAGGWRLGTFTFPKQLNWLLDKIAIVASETYTSVSAPIQHAAVEAFKGGTEIEEYLWRTRKILRLLGAECVSILRAGGIQVHDTTGGFYLFVDFSQHTEKLKQRGITTSAGLCARLLNEAGVAILPGSAFARSENELTARIAYVDFDGAGALAAARTVRLGEELPDDFIGVYCFNVLQGMKRLTEWVNAIG